jgi:hypothetical protein
MGSVRPLIFLVKCVLAEAADGLLLSGSRSSRSSMMLIDPLAMGSRSSLALTHRRCAHQT